MTITLKTSDGEIFEMEEAAAMQAGTIELLIEDDCAGDVIPSTTSPPPPSPGFSSTPRVSQQHAAADDNDDLKSWVAGFLKVDLDALIDLLMFSIVSLL
ncbi:SKP1-like protein 1 [Malania oleifera]|uniref:SKP1-like protein 1 n=1 Tax=Malania oleifera TaxID=397392 RepID=UPI0025AE7098|nr:SKP1-like protein 1 [Malania oleifera]